MLQTPLGALDIQIDKVSINYTPLSISVHQTCKDLDGRYAIVIPFYPDQLQHTISCRIKNYKNSKNDEPEPGENLELFSFYQNGTKLSIGMVGDAGCINGERLATYDYDTEYLADGVQYRVLPITKTTKFIFGVAWINEVTEANNIQTWFGADPTLYEYPDAINE